MFRKMTKQQVASQRATMKAEVERRIVAARPELSGRLNWDDINYLVDHTHHSVPEIVERYLHRQELRAEERAEDQADARARENGEVL